MTSLLENIAAGAKRRSRHIVLPEGDDERVFEGALRAARDGVARVTLIGDHGTLQTTAAGAVDDDRLKVVQPKASPHFQSFVDDYFELRSHKGVTVEAARAAIRHPLGFAAMMVRHGLADGTLGGAAHTTGETLLNALQIIGPGPDSPIVSSVLLMILENQGGLPVAFADCALVVEPTVEELAGIAAASARTFGALTGETPRVAMLAFSTKGSAEHESVKRVAEATLLAKSANPDLIIDGEMQFDAAFVPTIGAHKAPGSEVAGQANVFIFPNLHAGNIGYKIAERIGGATAIGPILQGLRLPANDLSRGCSVDDIYYMIAVTALQAAA